MLLDEAGEPVGGLKDAFVALLLQVEHQDWGEAPPLSSKVELRYQPAGLSWRLQSQALMTAAEMAQPTSVGSADEDDGSSRDPCFLLVTPILVLGRL